jgi:ADP-ribosylglycohydrolase
MLGAIAGDIIGSVYEARPTKRTDFPLFHRRARFTDDSVLTIAVAAALLDGRDYAEALWTYGRRYPDAGYGASFIGWLAADSPEPYGSFGNGAAMRVSPVGFFFDDAERVLAEAEQAAAVSHDHPEGIRGAQATAFAVLRARAGVGAESLRGELEDRFGYDLARSVDAIRPDYGFDVTCQGSVPEAVVCALESRSWEAAVRNAVSLGGDADTQACIAGGVAEALHGGVPRAVAAQALEHLDADLRAVTERFRALAGGGA